jgi:hypothetical protein
MWEVLDDWCIQKGKNSYRSIIMNAIVGNVMNLTRLGDKNENRLRRRLLRLWKAKKWLIARPRYWTDPAFWHAFGIQSGLLKISTGLSVQSEKELN